MGNSQDKKLREELGDRLRAIREKKKLTQNDIAEQAGINVNYYARIERGEVNFSIDIFKNIVKALGVKSSEILPF